MYVALSLKPECYAYIQIKVYAPPERLKTKEPRLVKGAISGLKLTHI